MQPRPEALELFETCRKKRKLRGNFSELGGGLFSTRSRPEATVYGLRWLGYVSRAHLIPSDIPK